MEPLKSILLAYLAKLPTSTMRAARRTRWPRSAMRSHRCCASTAGATSLPLPVTMPASRNGRCDFLACPHDEITLTGD